MVENMWKYMRKYRGTSLIVLTLFALAGAPAKAMPQLPAEAAALPMRPPRMAYSPLPSHLRQGGGLMLVRDIRQAGGGQGGACWTHCYNSYDECMGLKDKNVCVAQIKMCMETCDRLAGPRNTSTGNTSNASQRER